MIDINGTELLERTINATTRFVIHVGGSRSGKTVALAQHAIVKCIQEPGIVFTVVRKTLPALKATAYRDVKEQLETLDLWEPDAMNLTEMTYAFPNGSCIEFISVDNSQKIRGRKRDYAWLNEANELTREDFTQLALRTSRQMYFDFNPSEPEHWLYDIEDDRPLETTVIQSTFLDNPFLPDEIINEIIALKDTDPEAYKVFALGQRGSARDLVYPNWDTAPEFPVDCETVCYGIDFGFTDPTAMVRVGFRDKELFVEEVFCKSGLSQNEITDLVATRGARERVWADAAEPDRILELSRAGVNIAKARKDVQAGIASVKSRKIVVCGESPNLIAELRMYRWKRDAAGNPTEAVEGRDHCLDAMRYAVFNENGGRPAAPWRFAVGRL
jgi:phage terminase large subunit